LQTLLLVFLSGINLNYPLIGEFVALFVLFFLSGFYASAEVGLFSLTPVQLSELKDDNHKQVNKIILHLLNRPKKLIATLIISNNLVNIAAIILSSVITAQLGQFDNNPVLAFVIQIVVVTFLIVLIGEVMPKVYAAHRNMSIVKMAAYPVYITDKLLTPISVPLVSSTSFLEKIFKRKSYNVTLDQLTHAIDITDDADSPPEEKRILKGIVSFGNIDVRQIIKPRNDVVAFSLDLKFSEVKQQIRETGYSRIPVYKNTIDNIKGVLHIKDLIAYLDKDDSFKWSEYIRPTYFIPESKKINDLLQEFRQKKIHMAIVVDEFGGTLGIVTLEDVLEEIVGELRDEFDDEEPSYTKIDDNSYVFEAKILLNDMCRIINYERSYFDDVEGNIDTLAGLILELNGTIPLKGDTISYKELSFFIESADKRRIKRVKVVISKPEPVTDED
jgi:gliding motility-associated protein GldE